MGGAVSSGRDNNELIDNLMGGNYIRTRTVERVFRALDRAEYMTPDSRDQAYKDLAWRSGSLHMSAPCIYSEVLEGLELKPGLSFLNIGSGTGYFSTMVGLIIGSSGINHGIEVHPFVLDYSIKKLGQFIENSPILDDFDFCVPKFYSGNAMCLAPLQAPYDRLYCGAGCPLEYHAYFKQLIKIGGILVMPLGDNLVQIRRTAVDGWSSHNLLNVSFATLRLPTKEEAKELIKLEEQCPARLQLLCRGVVRGRMRAAHMARHPQLREPPPAPPRAPACPRRICIPIEDDSDVEGLNALHDLDHVNGANEMNALLSLVLSMGQNRVAGALRFDSLDSASSSSSSSNDEDHGDGGDDDDDNNEDRPVRPSRSERRDRSERSDPIDGSERQGRTDNRRSSSEPPPNDESPRSLRFVNRQQTGVIKFEFRDGSRNPGTSRRRCAETSNDRPASDTAENEKRDSHKRSGVPAEVEIYLGKETPSTSRTEMEWEANAANAEAKKESSSEEETTETSKKRKKLDSGIGEGTMTSSGSSPLKSESNEADESDVGVGRSDMSEGDNTTGRRRRRKRSRCVAGPRSRSSSASASASGGSGDDADADAEAEAEAGSSRRRKRRAPAHSRRLASASAAAAAAAAASAMLPPRNGEDARRVRLSILMKRGVKELPLPYALKKYVNLGRCFEF